MNEYIEGMIDGQAESEAKDVQQKKRADQPTVVLQWDLRAKSLKLIERMFSRN